MKNESICPGMRGFLVTCFRNQESRCISEFYDLMNKILEDGVEQEDDSCDEIDFEKALADEVATIKHKKPKVIAIKNDIKGVVFFKTPNSVDVMKTVDEIIDSAKCRTWKPKYIRRVLPVLVVTSASISELEKGLRRNEFFQENFKTYSVLVESRLNQTLSKKIVLDLAVQLLGTGHKVDLKNPDVCFFVEMIKNSCCLGIVKNYFALKKYNLALFTAGKFIAGGLIIKDYFAEAAFCSGQSMLPTLNDKDILLVSKFKKPADVEVGQMYIFSSPNDPGKLVCKRVIAKEGNIIQCNDENGAPIVRIPKGHKFRASSIGTDARKSRGTSLAIAKNPIVLMDPGLIGAQLFIPAIMLQAPRLDQPATESLLQIKISNGVYGKSQILELPTKLGRCPRPDGKMSQLALESPYISREHLLIEPESSLFGRKRVLLTDLGSSNGTYLNGKKLPTNTRVAASIGDTVQLGAVENEYQGNPISFSLTAVDNKTSTSGSFTQSTSFTNLREPSTGSTSGSALLQSELSIRSELSQSRRIIEVYEISFCVLAFIIAAIVFNR